MSVLDQLPTTGFKFSLGSSVGFITWALIIILFGAFIFVVAFFLMNQKKFKYKIIIFEKVDGRFIVTRKDRAMESKVGKMGHPIFFLRKHRVYKQRPKLQTGKKTYWYFIREDGTWINFAPGDFDEQSRSMGAHMIDTDMRMADAELESTLKGRYDKPKLWAQYGTVIISMGFIVIIAVMAWFLFDKWIEIANTINSGQATTVEVLDKLNTVLSRTDNLCSNSGMKSAV